MCIYPYIPIYIHNFECFFAGLNNGKKYKGSSSDEESHGGSSAGLFMDIYTYMYTHIYIYIYIYVHL